ncbi:hypothetical protein [Streptomyces rhizosphaericus]|uniref:hypothetical protein n=1 Tax=Streptomyces rhizosphaericus TaxID=114699 RepID=UPI001FCA378A|nr:hypothetical protein [Streptomyces rhizosphaericus]
MPGWLRRGWGREVQDAVRTYPAQQVNGQARKQEAQSGYAIAGINNDQGGRGPDLSPARRIQPLEHFPGPGRL